MSMDRLTIVIEKRVGDFLARLKGTEVWEVGGTKAEALGKLVMLIQAKLGITIEED